MSLDYAILGFLNYQPLSGYDLKKAFDHSVRHFWYADQSQIYRTLARLTAQGWAEVEVVEQTERPDRKVYHITPEGKEELHRWLKSPYPDQPQHSAPLIQVFFFGQLTDEEVRAKFSEAAALFRSTLERFENVPQQAEDYMQMVASPREAFFGLQTLELGIQTLRLQLEWAENVLRILDQHEIPQK